MGFEHGMLMELEFDPTQLGFYGILPAMGEARDRLISSYFVGSYSPQGLESRVPKEKTWFEHVRTNDQRFIELNMGYKQHPVNMVMSFWTNLIIQSYPYVASAACRGLTTL